MAVVAFPTRCVGLESAAHDQEVAVLGGQPGKTRPMPEQGFMGESQGLASLAVVGHNRRAQPSGPRRHAGAQPVPRAARFGRLPFLCPVDLDKRQQERRESGFEVRRELLNQISAR